MTEAFAFSPLDPALRRAPWALYARGRREHPAFVHAGLPMRLVSLFRYADVQATLRDDGTFSNSFPLYESKDAEEAIFVGEVFSGPGAERVYEFLGAGGARRVPLPL